MNKFPETFKEVCNVSFEFSFGLSLKRQDAPEIILDRMARILLMDEAKRIAEKVFWECAEIYQQKSSTDAETPLLPEPPKGGE